MLDNSSQVVDVTLTKRGRRKLAEGMALDISYFGLSDIGVDYRVYNPDHPDGTDKYGTAIENLPQIEASTNATIAGRSELLSLERNQTALPVLSEIADVSLDDKILKTHTFSPQLFNYYGEAGDYIMIVQDSSRINVAGAQEMDISDVYKDFPFEKGIKTAKAYRGTDFTVSAKSGLTKNTTMRVQFRNIETGATVSSKITLKRNIDQGTINVVSGRG